MWPTLILEGIGIEITNNSSGGIPNIAGWAILVTFILVIKKALKKDKKAKGEEKK